MTPTRRDFVSIRVSRQEHATIVSAARESGVSVSEFARTAALERAIEERVRAKNEG